MQCGTLLLVEILLITVSQVWSGNVLVLCPMCPRSHKNVIEATIGGLAQRNHSITIVSSYKTPIESPNIRDIVVMDGFDYDTSNSLIQLRARGFISFYEFNPYSAIIEGCHATYKNPEFINLLNSTFDLILIDAFANHCLQPFAHKLKAPVIRSMPLPAPAAMAMQTGNYFPPSIIPDPLLGFGEQMNFFQRTVNFIVPKLLYYVYYVSWFSKYETIAKQYLGEDSPSLIELELDISMTFQNTHFLLNYPRPTMPDYIEVVCIHCRKGRPLPKDLEEFVSESNEGLILFSLGSVFRNKDMPDETRKAILNVFSRLKQRVLWKWEHEDMKDLPPNVKLSKWLPLQDVLAHSNTKLFITHGGMLSTQEALYHGVPMVGIPLFFDQDININRYVELGVAVFVEVLNLKETDLSDAINIVLNNPEYGVNIKTLSTIFRDQPQSGIDTAVFWSEYVMRHKGAPQLRSIARKLNFIQFHCLDVMIFLMVIFLGILVLAVWASKKLVCKNFDKRSCAIYEQKKLQ